MSKHFKSYEELLQEKQRLEVLLQVQKEVIRQDIQDIKVQLQPARDALNFVKKFATKDKTSIALNIGSDLLITTVLKKFILARAGWFTRLVVPFLIKNYSSHFLAEKKDKWFHKLSNWLGGKNGKEHKKAESPENKGEEDVF